MYRQVPSVIGLMLLGIGWLGCTVDFGRREPGPATCGDHRLDASEVCDGDALGGLTCEDLGYHGGTLACQADCSAFDESGCEGRCGDGIINGSEVCDGSALDGRDCLWLGHYGGTLACQADCSAFDESGCEGRCGDGVISGAEVCEATVLGGADCASRGYYSGTLACQADCSAFDESGCEGRCGDGVVNGPEACDDTALGGRLCSDFGYYGGTLACLQDCTGFRYDGCWSVPRVLINEISPAVPDWVELVNVSEVPLDLEGWTLAWGTIDEQSHTQTGTLVLPAYVLAPGEYVVLVDEANGNGDPPTVSAGTLQYHENITWGSQEGAALLSTDAGDPVDHVRWGGTALPVPPGVTWTDPSPALPAPGEAGQTVTLSRIPDAQDTDSGADFCVVEGTPQQPNTGPCLVFAAPGTLLITEVNPVTDGIELYNPGPANVDLDGWQIRYATWQTGRRLLPAYVLAPNHYVWVNDDASDPAAPYADNQGCHVGSMTVNATHGTVSLAEPEAGAGVDHVCWGWSCLAPLPPDVWTGGSASIIGDGQVLGRLGTVDTDDVSDWCLQAPSPGVVNTTCQ